MWSKINFRASEAISFTQVPIRRRSKRVFTRKWNALCLRCFIARVRFKTRASPVGDSMIEVSSLYRLHSEWPRACSADATIKISAADVEVVMQELEVTKEEAHIAVVQANGDVVRALRNLLR